MTDKKWEIRLLGSGDVTVVDAPTRELAVKRYCKEHNVYPSIYIKCHYAKQARASC